MGSVNKVILVGNLGRDAEVRYAAAGQAVANFSLATTEVWTGRDGEKREQTEWHRVALWGKQAESIGQYLVKGKQVFVEGRLQSRRVPKCRECDSFLPEREVRVEGVRPADLPDIKCGRCGKTAKPYLDTQVEIRGDRVTLLGSAGGGGARSSGMDRGEVPQSGQMNEPADVPEDDIPF